MTYIYHIKYGDQQFDINDDNEILTYETLINLVKKRLSLKKILLIIKLDGKLMKDKPIYPGDQFLYEISEKKMQYNSIPKNG